MYGWSQTIELAIALALLDVGLGPDQVAKLSAENSQNVIMAAAGFILRAAETGELINAARHGKWPIQTTVFLHGTAFAIAGIKSIGEAGPGALGALGANEVFDWFESSSDVGSSVFLVDLGTKLATLVSLVVQWTEIPLEKVILDIERWADEVVENALNSLDERDDSHT